jgi:hypothetical protein
MSPVKWSSNPARYRKINRRVGVNASHSPGLGVFIKVAYADPGHVAPSQSAAEFRHWSPPMLSRTKPAVVGAAFFLILAASARASLLAPADDSNGFVFNNLTATGGDTEGRLAVGNNFQASITASAPGELVRRFRTRWALATTWLWAAT